MAKHLRDLLRAQPLVAVGLMGIALHPHSTSATLGTTGEPSKTATVRAHGLTSKFSINEDTGAVLAGWQPRVPSSAAPPPDASYSFVVVGADGVCGEAAVRTLRTLVPDASLLALSSKRPAVALDPGACTVTTADGARIGFEQLLVATGGAPSLIPSGNSIVDPGRLHGIYHSNRTA